jgi:hypothetical protein
MTRTPIAVPALLALLVAAGTAFAKDPETP